MVSKARATTLEDRIAQLEAEALERPDANEALANLLEKELRDVWLFGPPHRRSVGRPWEEGPG
jgi:hypothetical protein